PNLAPGQTATLNFTLFTLTTNARGIQVYTQAASTPDVDSSPGNLPISGGLWACTDNEDDEAVLTLNGGAVPCAITASVTNIACSNYNTPSNPNDDIYTFTVTATNPAGGTGYQMFIPQLNQTHSGTYGSPLFIQNMPIAAGNLTLNFTDNTTANCSATASVTAPPPCSVPGLPDLSGIVHEIIPGTNNCFTAPGQPFGYMAMQINNTGDVAATAFKVKFYFSTDNELSANDLLWSTVNVPSLNIMSNGGPAFISPGQPVPASLAPGQYYVIVTIDEDNQVAESNEGNNTINPFTTQIGAPDVTLDNFSGLPATVAAGTSFAMQVTVKYQANGFTLPASTSFPVNVSIVDVSPNLMVGSVNYTIGDFSLSNTVTKTVQVSVPASAPVGTHSFRMYANTSFCEPVYQSNYKDQIVNVTTGGSGIDLELSLAQNTANPVIYSTYTTTATLVNKGPQAATGVKVKWTKPAGVVYTGGNEFVASQGSFNPNGDQVWTVGTIPANGSATLTVSYFLLQNGAPSTYAQVTAANETDVDSQPNNGTPPTVNEDDEAATGGSVPPVLKPDLTISNLVIGNSPVQPGQVLTYNFDLANIGNGAASADFKVKAWISTDPYFSSNDIQDGIVPTGNFIAGFSVSGVPGSSTLPSVLAAGQYYLLLKVDADEVISESNESNNWVSGTFLVQTPLLPGNCDNLLGGGSLNCTSRNAAGQLEVLYQSNTTLSKALLDANGQVISNQSIGAAPLEVTYNVQGDQMSKKVGGTAAYTLTIPAALFGQYDSFLSFTEFNGGYVLFAMKNTPTQVFAIRTNAALAVQQTALLNFQTGPFQYFYIRSPMQVSANELAFIYQPNSGAPTYGTLHLAVLGGDLLLKSDEVLASNYFYGGATLLANSCGTFSIRINLSLYFCSHGSCYASELRQGHFENGQFVTHNAYLESELSTYGYGTRSHTWKLRTSDGGLINGTMTQQLPLYQNPPNNVIHLEKMLGGSVAWTKDVTVASAGNVRRLGMSVSELVFLSEKNNAVFVEALNCLEGTLPPTGCAAINITSGTGSLTIANAVAPHVLIKVFNPNWTLAFQCLDNCANPLTINNLNAGTYHIQVKLINNGWGEICYLEKDVNVTSFGAGGGTGISRSDDRQRLVLDRFYPSPTSYQVTVDVFSPVEQAATLDFYDQMGRPVHSMKVQLDKGSNAIPVLVFDWKSGAYNVIMRGEETGLPAYGRFLKVWEE
ncbi:MAG: DUF11 domain-containing protein, partial [Saprospiraceae bacterium]|nr:DUF11 domain-containing protein [Saprospiraceae bacterium]